MSEKNTGNTKQDVRKSQSGNKNIKFNDINKTRENMK